MEISKIVLTFVRSNSNKQLTPKTPIIMKKSVEVVKEQVVESLGSLFTKEDVIKVIDSIEVSQGVGMDEDKMKEIEEHLESMENLIEQIESDVDDLEVDEDDVEFGLDGNRLYVENVNFDKSSIESTIRDLKEQIEEFKKMFVVS